MYVHSDNKTPKDLISINLICSEACPNPRFKEDPSPRSHNSTDLGAKRAWVRNFHGATFQVSFFDTYFLEVGFGSIVGLPEFDIGTIRFGAVAVRLPVPPPHFFLRG